MINNNNNKTKLYITPAPSYLLVLMLAMYFIETAYCMQSILSPEQKIEIFTQYVLAVYDNGYNIVSNLDNNNILKNLIFNATTDIEIKKIADIYCSGFDDGVGFSVKSIIFKQ